MLQKEQSFVNLNQHSYEGQERDLPMSDTKNAGNLAHRGKVNKSYTDDKKDDIRIN